MARSYKSVADPESGRCTTGGYTRGPPLVGTPRGPPAAGRPAREVGIARSYERWPIHAFPFRNIYSPVGNNSRWSRVFGGQAIRKTALRVLPAWPSDLEGDGDCLRESPFESAQRVPAMCRQEIRTMCCNRSDLHGSFASTTALLHAWTPRRSPAGPRVPPRSSGKACHLQCPARRSGMFAARVGCRP